LKRGVSAPRPAERLRTCSEIDEKNVSTYSDLLVCFSDGRQRGIWRGVQINFSKTEDSLKRIDAGEGVGGRETKHWRTAVEERYRLMHQIGGIRSVSSQEWLEGSVKRGMEGPIRRCLWNS